MSGEKKVEEDGVEEALTASEWLKMVDGDMVELRTSPYEMESERKLTVEGVLLAKAIGHLREAVMSLAMGVAHLKNMAEIKEAVSAGGKKSMGRTKS